MNSKERIDAEDFAAVLGEAFADDPVSQWTLGNRDRIEAVFRILAGDGYLAGGACKWIAGQGAVLARRADGPTPASLRASTRIALRLLRDGRIGAIGRALRLAYEVEARRPRTPHLYLHAIGVVARARGTGLGGRLLRSLIADADASALPIWLESTKPENVALYRRFGFEARETFYLPDGPPITTMIRSPS